MFFLSIAVTHSKHFQIWSSLFLARGTVEQCLILTDIEMMDNDQHEIE